MGIENTDALQPEETPAQPVEQSAGYPSNQDQEDAQLRREQELDAERQQHNERTGGADVQEGAIREEREEHQRRTEGDSAE